MASGLKAGLGGCDSIQTTPPAAISGPRLGRNPGPDRAFYVTIPTSHCAIKSK
jgi:hypothetical protein